MAQAVLVADQRVFRANQICGRARVRGLFHRLYPDRSDLGVSSVDPDIGDLFDMATGLSKPVLDRDRFRVELCCRGGVSHAVADQDAD